MNGVRVTQDADIFQVNPPLSANVINGGGWSRPASELTIRGAVRRRPYLDRLFTSGKHRRALRGEPHQRRAVRLHLLQ